ncbi:hypothetical protein CR513_50216, partial [Mucuna pruriens]
MKGSCCLANTHKLYSPLPLSNANNHVISYQNRLNSKVRNLSFIVDKSLWSNKNSTRKSNGFVVGCASWSSVRELEKELEAEMKTQEGEEKDQSNGMTKFRHKCGEVKGVVEMLECLEREAIMGEDVGKEPMDYNRRAKIFYTSSRVFQALKEHNNNNGQFIVVVNPRELI